MNLPAVEQPQRLRGLYVYDFGDWTAVGYTAEEIGVLLESEEHRDGKVYKIQRAYPDGGMELRGVSPERFRLESGMLFYSAELGRARADFADLRAAAERTPPPRRAFLHLAERSADVEADGYVMALVYPAESEDEMGAWVASLGFEGGDRVEGGISHVSNYYGEDKTIIERYQLWSQAAIQSRCATEVLASVRRAVQR